MCDLHRSWRIRSPRQDRRHHRVRHRADPRRGLRPDEAGQGNDRSADGRVLGQWNASEELSSYLVEITEVCLRTGPVDGTDLVEKITDQAGQKGTGLWTVVTALQMGALVPTIYVSLNAG